MKKSTKKQVLHYNKSQWSVNGFFSFFLGRVTTTEAAIKYNFVLRACSPFTAALGIVATNTLVEPLVTGENTPYIFLLQLVSQSF